MDEYEIWIRNKIKDTWVHNYTHVLGNILISHGTVMLTAVLLGLFLYDKAERSPPIMLISRVVQCRFDGKRPKLFAAINLLFTQTRISVSLVNF